MTGPRFDGDLAAQWRAGRPGHGRRRLSTLVDQAYRQMRHDDAAEVAERRAARGRRHGRAGALYCQDGRP